MKSYCLKCRKNIENINPNVSGTSNIKAMILLKCAVINNQDLLKIKTQKLLRNLGLRTQLNKVPKLGGFLF